MPTGSRCHLRFELVCISCNTITAVAECAASLAVAIPSRRVGAGNVRLREEWGLAAANTITEVAARASMPTESSLVSSTLSLPAPPARECWRRLEPTSKRTATTGMRFSCAPALVSEQGIARSEQAVHDISRQTFTDSEAQAHRHFRHRLRVNVGAMSSQHRTNGNHCDETVIRLIQSQSPRVT